jgi:alanine racemase
LATLAYGYADGYPRAASNKGYVMFGAEKAPIVGRVSMDLLTVDVSRIANVNVGDYAELLNDTITVNDVAAQADTIGYEILTRLGSRAERVYHD